MKFCTMESYQKRRNTFFFEFLRKLPSWNFFWEGVFFPGLSLKVCLENRNFGNTRYRGSIISQYRCCEKSDSELIFSSSDFSLAQNLPFFPWKLFFVENQSKRIFVLWEVFLSKMKLGRKFIKFMKMRYFWNTKKNSK